MSSGFRWIDVEAGLVVCDGNRDFFVRLCAVALESASVRCRLLDRMAAESDLVGMQRLAHSLKSELQIVGGATLSEEARRLEMACKTGDLAEAGALAAAFSANLRQAFEELKVLLAS